VPGSFVAQLFGGVLAARFLKAMFGTVGMTWVYVIGPVLGALIGVAFEWVLKGKATAAGALAAQGLLDNDNSTKSG